MSSDKKLSLLENGKETIVRGTAMKYKITTLLGFMAILISSCVAQKKACIATFNETRCCDKILPTKRVNVFYLSPISEINREKNLLFFEKLNMNLKRNNQPEIQHTNSYSVNKFDSSNLHILDTVLDGNSVANTKLFLIRAYISNSGSSVFEVMSFKRTKFCQYLKLVGNNTDNKIVEGPFNGEIRLSRQNDVEHLISTYGVLIYRNQSFEYVPFKE